MTTWKSIAVATAVALVSGCSKDTTTTTTAPNAFEFSKTYTLQGVIADAVTGARIGGADLKVFLIQGAEVRGPTRLNSADTDPLVGEYAFAGIPADANSTNKTYKVVVVKPGYQRFEADVAFVADWSDLIDTVYNKIGNIYLFPIGVTAPPYEFTVLYRGKPVPSATVLLDPIVDANDPTFTTSDVLSATGGLVASLSAVTDANGKVTFAGNTLAVGARYQPQVLPVDFTDSGTVYHLALTNGSPFFAGLGNASAIISLGDLTPSGEQLYVVSASNQPSDQLQASGRLVITFNTPVALVNPNGFAGTLAGNTTAALSTATPVNASLSTDGLVLTLSPNYQTVPAGDRALSITYADGTGRVSPLNNPAASYGVFADLELANGAHPSGLVAITGP